MAARAESTRGAATRARLLQAARDVVAEVGYPHATTRAIADAAGVAEGTIYRHFPNKPSLFLAAVADANAPIMQRMTELPARAGEGTVHGNLLDAMTDLAQLREHVLPLELAMLTDPDLAAERHQVLLEGSLDRLPGPPGLIAEYLAAEQGLGRVRADLEPGPAAAAMLAGLFGLALLPAAAAGSGPPDVPRVSALVDLAVRGLLPESPGVTTSAESAPDRR